MIGLGPATSAVIKEHPTAPSPPSDLAGSKEHIHFAKVVVDPFDHETLCAAS